MLRHVVRVACYVMLSMRVDLACVVHFSQCVLFVYFHSRRQGFQRPPLKQTHHYITLMYLMRHRTNCDVSTSGGGRLIRINLPASTAFASNLSAFPFSFFQISNLSAFPSFFSFFGRMTWAAMRTIMNLSASSAFASKLIRISSFPIFFSTFQSNDESCDANYNRFA